MDKYKIISAAICLASFIGMTIVDMKKTEHDLKYNLCSPAKELLHEEVVKYQKEHPEDKTPYNELYNRFYKEHTERYTPKFPKKFK